MAIVLAAGPAAYAARTDVIVLRNGDHFTGEVLEMRRGKLQVKTDDAGTLSIEWDKVVSVTTAAAYDVAMQDGTRYFGRLQAGAPRSLVVASDGATTALPMEDVASLATIKATFLDRIDGSLDLGASYAQSTGVGQLTFDTDASYRQPAFSYSAMLSTTLTRQEDQPDTIRYSLKLDYTRYSQSSWFVTAFGLFEGNRDLGFTFRGTGAFTVGRFLVRSNRLEFVTTGGMAAGREQPVDQDMVTNVDAVAGAALSIFAYDYPRTSMDIGALVFPSLDDPGRVRINASTKLKRELFKDFFFSTSAYDSYDNRPKATGSRQNDFGAAVSFGWSF